VPKKEAQARIRINRLLEQVGWRFFPDKNGPDNIICESRISKKTYSPGTDFGDDFEKVIHGFVDYLLLNLERKPVAVVEAKREGIDPLDSKEPHTPATCEIGALKPVHAFRSFLLKRDRRDALSTSSAVISVHQRLPTG